MNSKKKWLDQLGSELMRAAAEQTKQGSPRRTRFPTAVAIAALSLLLFVGAAFAAQTWISQPEPTHEAGIVAESNEPISLPRPQDPDDQTVKSGSTCHLGSSPALDADDAAPQKNVVDSLSVLRNAANRSTNAKYFGSEYPETARLVSAGGLELAIAVVPDNPYRNRSIPNTAACAPFKALSKEPSTDRVCVAETSPDGGQTCSSIARIEAGDAYFIEDNIPGEEPTLTRIIGLAPDGVGEVRITTRTRSGTSTTRVRVKNNAYSFSYQGSATVMPEIQLIR